jgi:DNA polymerase-3 subunit gamma/tau
MDAASNRGIDDIRALRDRIALAPAESPYIVYIIDEVHMLTTEAFNALLKTLEEPPAHAVFALCTTELHKLPQTVVSRCTSVYYPKPTVDEVMGSLQKAVVGENLTISPEALKALAESVDGSFRDGMKLLEQLAQKGVVIADASVFELVHQTTSYDVTPFVEALLAKNMTSALATLSKMEEQSVDVSVYIKKMLMELREKLHFSMEHGGENARELVSLIELVAQAGIEAKTAYIPLLSLEVMTAERCLSPDQKLNTKDQNVQAPQPTRQPAPGTKKVQEQVHKPPQATPTVLPVKNDEPVPVVQRPSMAGEISLSLVESKWPAVLAGIKPFNHSLEALLRSSRPVSVQDSSLVIEVFYAFHRDRLDEEKNKRAIEKVVDEVLGSSLRLSFVLGSGDTKPLPIKMVASSTPTDLMSAAEEIFS